MTTTQDLVTAVAAESTLDDSIITMLDGIVKQLTDAKAKDAATAAAAPAVAGAAAAPAPTPEMDAVLASITANVTKLQAAITANTPVVVVPAGVTTVPPGTSVTVAPATGVTQEGVTPVVAP